MAGNKTLNPTNCRTASEAFKYPLPQVRQLHRSLTVELDEKNARLRTLVGGSYRQLLGTAEMILQMRDNIGVVEDSLGRVGKGCGRGVIGGMARGLGKLQATQNEGRPGDDMGWLAKAKALDMCAIAVGKLLRRGTNATSDSVSGGRGKNLALAAKVLGLSRLLAKSLIDSAPGRTKDENDRVEEARNKLKSLRGRLERAIEKSLESSGGTDAKEDLLHALCAYSLTTSSGAKDVLRHFLLVRGAAMTLAFEEDADAKQTTPGVMKALVQYTQTLLDVQILAPRRLADALADLKAKPLLKDETIREMEALRLDVCERWFGDQISFFTPYIRHDDLEGSQIVEDLRGWAKKASDVLLQGFGKFLQRIVDFKTVVELRTKILELWIKDGGKAKGFDPSTVLNGFRSVINNRMVAILESRASKLHLVGTEIGATLSTWKQGVLHQHSSLWSEDMFDMEISKGATIFKQDILARANGRNLAVSRAVNGYKTWRHLINEIVTVLEQLGKQRWDADLEDIVDDLSIESRNVSLSKDDPRMLRDHLDLNLERAYTDLDQKLSAHLSTYGDSENIGQMSVYILRILREIRSELPKNESLQGFGLPIVPSLHERIAIMASESALERFDKAVYNRRVVGRGLWEGDPKFPVQPSPKSFKLLHSLALAMASVGADVWSPAATSTLKQYLVLRVSQSWKVALELFRTETPDHVTGIETSDEPTDGGQNAVEVSEKEVIDTNVRRDLLIQSLFDILVLQSSFETSKSKGSAWQAVEESIDSQLELDVSSRKRLQNSAKDYWKRSCLLFGLLA